MATRGRQPIDTAPKTGEWIDARSKTGFIWSVRWDGRNDGWFTPGNNRREDLDEWLCSGEPEPTPAPAANPAPEKKSQEWQPIDTAPKDGTRILLYVPIMAQHPGLSYCVARWIQYHAEIADQSGWYEADRTRVNFAEYWLPLDVLPPPPPKPDPVPEPTVLDLLRAELADQFAIVPGQCGPMFALGTRIADVADVAFAFLEQVRKDAENVPRPPSYEEIRDRIIAIRNDLKNIARDCGDIRNISFHTGRLRGVQYVLDSLFPGYAADSKED